MNFIFSPLSPLSWYESHKSAGGASVHMVQGCAWSRCIHGATSLTGGRIPKNSDGTAPLRLGEVACKQNQACTIL